MNKRPISLAGLRGFLAAARHNSFTIAATELHLTQSALSRQIQSLEEELEAPLFVRTTRKVSLTSAGVRLLQATTGALAEIDAAVAEIRPSTEARPISVTTFASFASLWLIPRLSSFAERCPGVDVNCLATDRAVDLEREGVDIALRAIAPPNWPADAPLLFDEKSVPVISPALMASRPVQTPADLAQHTLLAFELKFESIFPQLSWAHWLALHDAESVRPVRTMRFSNHDQVIQAALAGQGVALARCALIAQTLRDGGLLPVLGPPVASDIRYYVVVNRRSAQRPEVRAFVDWVAEEGAATRALLAEVFGGS
jgi:DNA-binding transcriptional LysR family regulator